MNALPIIIHVFNSVENYNIGPFYGELLMVKLDVKYPFFQQAESVKKHCLCSTGQQRYRYQGSCLSFQLDYEYRT